MTIRIERWRTPAAGVVSGILFALAFPPYELPVLAPLALVPWIAALAVEEKRSRGFFSGFLFGMAYWIASIPWIVYVVTRFGSQSNAMGVLSLVILAAINAEWPTVIGWAVVSVAPPRSAWRFAVFPFLWLAAEHVRANVYRGFPWNLTAEALYRHPIWIQSAAFWGAYGVGFLVVAVSTLLAVAAVERRMQPALAAALVALAVGISGAIRLSARPEPPAKTISFALLQPNIPQESRLLEDHRAVNYAKVLEQARAAAASRPDLIVIPESALPVYWETSATLRRDLTELARSCDCAILFNDVDIEANDRYYNAARLLTPRGMGEPYRKVHLVPFGEYVPLPRIFFFVRQVSTEIGEFSAAEEPSLLMGEVDSKKGSVPFSIGVGVCYEILYPVLSWKQVREGANLLVTISNDSWYGAGGAQAQHFAGAVLRAVENERYLLRAAITGISGTADERGRILTELGPDGKGTIRGTARLFTTRTPWTRYGFAFSGFCDAIAIAVLVFGLVRWRRERRLKLRRDLTPAGTDPAIITAAGSDPSGIRPRDSY
ncbi:MAG TPA: apolipoprotein N-acyltransferase [Thermoanaerobaculia bacterium]|jgi:apolipoprotein N-acyltransferase|nr:apolipoprotein N-acyltransferase [Thermoanaerobaculia bacterium]